MLSNAYLPILVSKYASITTSLRMLPSFRVQSLLTRLSLATAFKSGFSSQWNWYFGHPRFSAQQLLQPLFPPPAGEGAFCTCSTSSFTRAPSMAKRSYGSAPCFDRRHCTNAHWCAAVDTHPFLSLQSHSKKVANGRHCVVCEVTVNGCKGARVGKHFNQHHRPT